MEERFKRAARARRQGAKRRGAVLPARTARESQAHEVRAGKKCSSARKRRREKMKLVCVVGPTGCGKTWLGVELAKMLGGEVVSCDSMQIYRGMAIGTAAPTAEEMQGIPHHMVGVADPREKTTPLPAMRTTRRSASTISSRAGSSPSSSAARGFTSMPCSPVTASPAVTRTADTARSWNPAGTRRAARRCSSSSDASTPRPPEISI